MRYHSTRGQAPVLNFEDVLLTGLAADGGLYMPEFWPKMAPDRIASMAGEKYVHTAIKVISPFLGEHSHSLTAEDIETLVVEAYADFGHSAVAPLVQLDENMFLLELFHGPTLAFKDFALQLLGRMFDHVLSRKNRRLTIVGATSGDTGSAAIEACKGRSALDIFILHPHNRTSEVQRKQMTTVDAGNVYNIALDGTFDDCQNLVKQLFADVDFKTKVNMSAVNSINWVRVMAQIVYYFYAAANLGAPSRKLSFTVPSGNFGNILAGWGAYRMGLPVDQLICGSNRNDILARFFKDGVYQSGDVVPSLSPSMDIQISSNFERLLWDLHDQDSDPVNEYLSQYADFGMFGILEQKLHKLRQIMNGISVSDEKTLATMESVHRCCGGLLIDPHTAVGVAAAYAKRRNFKSPMVVLGTAHPAKFPDAVFQATGVRPALPEHLSDLLQRPEKFDILPNDFDTIRQYILDRV